MLSREAVMLDARDKVVVSHLTRVHVSVNAGVEGAAPTSQGSQVPGHQTSGACRLLACLGGRRPQQPRPGLPAGAMLTSACLH